MEGYEVVVKVYPTRKVPSLSGPAEKAAGFVCARKGEAFVPGNMLVQVEYAVGKCFAPTEIPTMLIPG